MADYSKFKNSNGDDLVLQDKALRDNVGFDSFTENEKILAGNIDHNTAGIILVHNGKIINANESSGGLYYDDFRQGIFVSVDGETIIEDYKCLSVANPVPDTDASNDGDVLTYNATSDEIVWAPPTTLHVDDDTIKNTNGTLSVNYGAGLTVYGYAGENKLCVANPVPTFTTADAGKVLTINAAGNGLEWTLPNVPANAVSLNNEPVGVNGDYFTVGEGQ